MRKVISEWRPLKDELCILYLDGKAPSKPYHNYRIEGNIYKPVPMSNTDGTCIAIKCTGSFLDKEVEFI